MGGLPLRSEKCVCSGEIDIYLSREMRGSQRMGIGPHASSASLSQALLPGEAHLLQFVGGGSVQTGFLAL